MLWKSRCVVCRLVATLSVAALAGAAAAPPAPKAAPAAREAFPYMGKVTGDRVYIRAGDGIAYTILTVAGPGDRVRVRTRRFDWLAIAVPGTCTLWVHKSLLEAQPDGKTAAVTGSRVNIRSRPKPTSDVMGQLAKGSRVRLVDSDGDWIGIQPPPQATAWIHRKYVRKTSEAVPTTPPPRVAPKDGFHSVRAYAILRDAQMIYNAELKKPPKERDFIDVLSAYQKVAEKCTDDVLARRVERARQRLLKIVDLHKALQAAREPIERFEKKYEKLEAEYKKRAAIGSGEEKKPE